MPQASQAPAHTPATARISKRTQARQSTYIDHSIGGDPEEGGSLIDGFDLLPALGRQLQVLQLTQGPLESRPVLGNKVIARA